MSIYREVKIEIISDAAVIDIVEQGFDAGVRFGQQLAQDMIALPLGPSLRYAIVASPDYIARHGRPQTPHDLAGHDCIRRRFPGGTLVTWWFTDGTEDLEVTPPGRLTVSTVHNELQAALAGRGIAHVIDDYAKPLLRDGRLVELLAGFSPILPHWFLYYPNRRLPSAAMRAFLDHMKGFDWTARG